MDKLANYGSDDDYEDSPKYRKTGTQINTDGRTEREQAQADANYEEVYMDLSEDSASSNSSRSTPERASRDTRGKSPKRDNRAPPLSSRRDEDTKYRNRGEDRRELDRRESKDDRREPKVDRRESKDDRRELKDDRRESKDDRRELKDDRREPKDDRREDRRGDTKERYRSRDDKYKDRHRDERNSRDRYRDDRRSRRSSSRDRRSRSPRRAEHRNRRSNSRDRDSRDGRDSRPSYGRKYDRYPGAKGSFEKQDTQKPPPVEEQKPKQDTDGNRFFMPGITGRFRDQIERRKLLWQKKDKDAVEKPVAAPSTSTGKVWQTTTFAQDTDGKVASKFKRLMGIREPGGDGQKPEGDILKKQEEMFSSMEQQYEVARTATHTMRGVGLGFGSFQR